MKQETDQVINSGVTTAREKLWLEGSLGSSSDLRGLSTRALSLLSAQGRELKTRNEIFETGTASIPYARVRHPLMNRTQTTSNMAGGGYQSNREYLTEQTAEQINESGHREGEGQLKSIQEPSRKPGGIALGDRTVPCIPEKQGESDDRREQSR